VLFVSHILSFHLRNSPLLITWPQTSNDVTTRTQPFLSSLLSSLLRYTQHNKSDITKTQPWSTTFRFIYNVHYPTRSLFFTTSQGGYIPSYGILVWFWIRVCVSSYAAVWAELMASDGFRAPYETYDNTTKYVFFSHPSHMFYQSPCIPCPLI